MATSARKFFSGADESLIVQAIAKAESEISGEIRVHIDSEFKGDVLDRAAYIFKKLGMTKTIHRNGILFYLAVQSRKFAVIGDKGINQKVQEGFWEAITDSMAEQFKQGNFAAGLAEGIEKAGVELKKHFPAEKNNLNELTDEISIA
ncbi:MAG TPA: TPM domain-containing protein [Bacteroidales bacterium]|nr:TPM domain-containing protein [Bacteroidales bacterium]